METINKGIIEYLKEFSEASPDVMFMYDEKKGFTVRELFETVQIIAYDLAKRGAKKGDYIAVKGLRTPEAVAMFLAVQYLGAVAVMCDIHKPVDDFINASGVKMDLAHRIDNADGKWVIDGEPYSVSAEREVPEDMFPEDRDYNGPALVIFTSGSTGVQKGVILSQFNYINHMRNYQPVGAHGRNDSAIQMLPIFHIFGLTQVFDGIMKRCPLFFPKMVTPDYICECIDKFHFTRFGFVPSFALAMADSVAKNGYDTSSLRAAVLAGAYSTREQFNYIQDQLGLTIIPVYGMSECPGISGAGPEESDDDRATSVGKILPLTEVKITDEGEITIKGPTVFLGYVGEEPIDRNEFFHTGDVGYIDERGFLHITGRIKDIIIRNGNNISSVALEKKLLSLDFVSQAAVVGVKDEKCGEVPMAMITLKEGRTYDAAKAEELFNKLEMPAKIEVVGLMPLNASGKIDKKKIRELFECQGQ